MDFEFRKLVSRKICIKSTFFKNFYTASKCKEDFMIDLGYAWLIGANDVN